jgi:hypothetical protein
MFNKNRSGAFLRCSLSGDASRCLSRPAFVVALLLLDIDTPSLPTILLFLPLTRLPLGLFRPLAAFPASKIEGKPSNHAPPNTRYTPSSFP